MKNEKPQTIPIKTVKTDSFTMDYFHFGQGKEILVILPGLSIQSVMNSADAVAEAYRQLTDDFTIYVFDRRKELPLSYSIDEMAKDTVASFRAIGLKRANIFGVSQGGMIAMKIAIAYPEFVNRLVLGSTAVRVTETAYQTIEKWIDLAKEQNANALYPAFGEMIYPQKVFENAKPLLLDAAKTVTKADLDRFVILAQGIKDFNVTQEMRKITCPVLVIGDSEDRLFGAESTEIITKALNRESGVELYLYHGYGHAAYDIAPDYKERILRFFLLQKRVN